MRVGIVGAGIAGLAAARKLKANGVEAVVFEKSGGVGGRCATRRAGGYTFDTGATSIAPRGRALERVMTQELDTADLVQVTKPIWAMDFGRINPGDAAKMVLTRYTYQSGMTKLAKLLAEGLNIRFEQKIEQITNQGGRYAMGDEAFDHIVLSAPAPQTDQLLHTLGEYRPLGNVRYRSCLSVLLGFAQPFDAPYHALIEPEQRSPVIWISVESIKSPGRAPEGHSAFVVQFGARYSQDHYEDSDFEVAREAQISLGRLFGNAFSTPDMVQVKRWRYSQPETLATPDHVNRAGSRVWVASDSLAGPRVELAFESGEQVAEMIMQEVGK